MDLTSLEIFQIVAAEMSITKAASRLGRAQSNVTTRVQQLEEVLHTQLFIRDGKRLRLSESGRIFLGYSKRLVALADEAKQAVHPTLPAGTLRIGAMESTAATRLPSVVNAFHRKWPDVDLNVSTGHSQGLINALENDLIDCAFIALQPRTNQECIELLESLSLTGQAVFHEEIMLLISDSYALDQDFVETPVRLAAFKSGCTYRALGRRWIAANWPKVDLSLEIQDVASYDEMIARVSAGQCAGFAPKSVLDRNGPFDGIRATHVLDVDTWLVNRKGYTTAALSQLNALTVESLQTGGTP